MNIAWSSLPLAFLAGILSVLSPCVWPLVPIVMGSAANAGRAGPLALAAGLSLAFAIAGTALSFLLVSLGLDPELFRYVAASLLVLVAVPLLVPPAALWLNAVLGRFTHHSGPGGGPVTATWPAQFGVGMLLGLVWLPCVGPTLGAAIALASLGQQMLRAFVVMLVFGFGTAAALLVAGVASAGVLRRWRPTLLAGAETGKHWLGVMVLLLGLLVLTGLDKHLERSALHWLPDAAVSL